MALIPPYLPTDKRQASEFTQRPPSLIESQRQKCQESKMHHRKLTWSLKQWCHDSFGEGNITYYTPPPVYICFPCHKKNISIGQKFLHTQIQGRTRKGTKLLSLNHLSIPKLNHALYWTEAIANQDIHLLWHIVTYQLIHQMHSPSNRSFTHLQIQSHNLIDNNWCLYFGILVVQTGTFPPKKWAQHIPPCKKEKDLNWKDLQKMPPLPSGWGKKW